VTVIDQDRKPNNGPHECDPTMIVIDSRAKALTYRFDYYMYGHFSRFVQRGAARIASTEGDRACNNVAFKNPDGSVALIAANDGDEPRRIALGAGGGFATHMLGPKSVVTYMWRP
jgi:glucosylceramidase